MENESTGGLYYLEINGKFYIGKDGKVSDQKRVKEHIRFLKRGVHYNPKLQYAFDKYDGNITYGTIIEGDYLDEELYRLEMECIEEYDTFHNGYNLTEGGEGSRGTKRTEEDKKKRSLRIQGEKNHNAKITEIDFFNMIEMFKSGKTNTEIANIYGLHSRYVSLIRHKKRYKHLWDKVKDYTPSQDECFYGKGDLKISEDTMRNIVRCLQLGETNKNIEKWYNLSSGTASRIRNGRVYKPMLKSILGYVPTKDNPIPREKVFNPSITEEEFNQLEF